MKPGFDVGLKGRQVRGSIPQVLLGKLERKTNKDGELVPRRTYPEAISFCPALFREDLNKLKLLKLLF